MRILPGDAVIREHLGDVYRAMGEMALARTAYEKTLELDPDNKQVAEKLQGLP